MVHVGQELLHEEAGIAEGGLGHGGGLEEGVLELGLVADGEDAPSAASSLGLEHDGQPYVADEPAGLLDVHGAVGAGHDRNAEPAGHGAGLHLVAEQVHGLLGGADEDDAVLLAQGREAAVLGREAPAGMDADHAAAPGLLHDGVDVEVGSGVGSQKEQFLRRGGRGRGLVDVGGRHGRNGIESLAYGAADAAGRNAAVGNQNGLALEIVLYVLESLVCHERLSFS